VAGDNLRAVNRTDRLYDKVLTLPPVNFTAAEMVAMAVSLAGAEGTPLALRFWRHRTGPVEDEPAVGDLAVLDGHALAVSGTAKLTHHVALPGTGPKGDVQMTAVSDHVAYRKKSDRRT
jgi:hypothetical protein